jgi:hypothetical protein
VSHRENVEELELIGRDTERVVLARTVKWHHEDRALVHENRTAVFNGASVSEKSRARRAMSRLRRDVLRVPGFPTRTQPRR